MNVLNATGLILSHSKKILEIYIYPTYIHVIFLSESSDLGLYLQLLPNVSVALPDYRKKKNYLLKNSVGESVTQGYESTPLYLFV